MVHAWHRQARYCLFKTASRSPAGEHKPCHAAGSCWLLAGQQHLNRLALASSGMLSPTSMDPLPHNPCRGLRAGSTVENFSRLPAAQPADYTTWQGAWLCLLGQPKELGSLRE